MMSRMRRLTEIFWSIVLLFPGIFDHSTDAQFNFYEIYPQGQCLRYYVLDDIVDYNVLFLPTHQIIPYCLQPLEDNQHGIFSSEEVTNSHDFFTFEQLKEKEVTSENLIQWSASLDVAEDYQIFLTDPNDVLASLLFYNCTKGWFGPRCNYTLYENDMTFAELIRNVFVGKREDTTWTYLSTGTCYQHLQCDRGGVPICIDWGEVCDGKRDCTDGADEPQQCFERESNECSKGFYRCHNGQCIPEEFYDDDDILNADCSDWTDRYDFIPCEQKCLSDPAFRCEEHVCSNEATFYCEHSTCALIGSFHYHRCRFKRFDLENQNSFADYRNPHLSPSCAFIMACSTANFYKINRNTSCESICKHETVCIRALRSAGCPSSPFVFPLDPVAFGHVHFLYAIVSLESGHPFHPFLICYDQELCGPILNATVYYNGYTCRHYSELTSYLPNREEILTSITPEKAIYQIFRQCAAAIPSNCTGLVQCPQSPKCISKHRLLDGKKDCLDNSDEEFNDTCSLNDPYRFKCSSGRKPCISPLLLRNYQSDCQDGEDEEMLASNIGYELLPPFSLLCNGRVEMDPLTIDDRIQSDETDCGSYFPCDNQYTRCDGFWNCINGLDEANCPLSPCKPFHHRCVSLVDMSIGCLPLELAGDGIVHCQGGSDERHFCRNIFPEEYDRRYQCHDQTFKCIRTTLLCDRTLVDELDDEDRCENEENTICPQIYFQTQRPQFSGICSPQDNFTSNAAQKMLCSLDETTYMINYNFSDSSLYLRLVRAGYFPSSAENASQSNENTSHEEQTLKHSNSLLYYTDRAWYCNRGMVLFVGGLEQRRCLCPPTYYGNRCQFQNQRVSLILQFRALTGSNFRTAFHLIFMLIDNVNIMQSYDYSIYVPVRDCGVKFLIYLTYASRPKNSTKNYRIVVNAFNKEDLTYYTSWYLSIPFQFLPVSHLVDRLIIREQRTRSSNDCTLKCGPHGQCMKYENIPKEFCQCSEGWWGDFCQTNYHCDCASHAKCIGTIGNRSICLCPLNKFGRRCHLTSSSCQLNTCQHGETCIPTDERISSNSFTCLCTDGHSGKRCEISGTTIIISFDDVTIPQSFYGHFIRSMYDEDHIRNTIFKKMPYDRNTVMLYRSTPFHILFVEFSQNYYLTVLQEKYTPSTVINTKILPSYRCLSFNTLFNRTILNYNRLRRIKHYYLPCQTDTNLQCFYDEEYMCLCDLDRHVNCFDFDHNMTYDCQGANYCGMNGKCFQDHPTCPTTSVCVCDECSYGTYCQLSTKGFDLSLDAILSYHIHSHLELSRQPLPFKISLIITSVIFVTGMISASLSIIVFQPKNFKVGCDIHLFAISIITLLMMNVVLMKFLVLVLSQTALITNHLLLFINCKSVDFFLKFLPNIIDWLSACVAIERALIVWQGVRFNKMKSMLIAKIIVVFVCSFVIGTAIHDPMHRRTIEDIEERRIWCIVEYSSTLKIFNRVVNIFHLFTPFVLNLLSALFLIITIARQRSLMVQNQTYRQHLTLQFRQHKHLFISPCVFASFGFPRLVMSFTSRCMKSTNTQKYSTNSFNAKEKLLK